MGTPKKPFLSLFNGERENTGYYGLIYANSKNEYSLTTCLENEWISLDGYRNRKDALSWVQPTFVSQNPILRTFLSNLLSLRERFIERRLTHIRHDMKYRPDLAKYMQENNRINSVVVGNPYHEQQFQYNFKPYLKIKINDYKEAFFIDSIHLNPDSNFYLNPTNPKDMIRLDLGYNYRRIITITFPRLYFDMNRLPPPTEITYRLVKTDEIITNQTVAPVATLSAPVATLLPSNTPEAHPLALTRSPSPTVLPELPPPVNNSKSVVPEPPQNELPPIPLSKKVKSNGKNNGKNNGIELVNLGGNGKRTSRRRNEEPAPLIDNARLGGSRRTKKRKHRRSKTSATKYRR